MNCLFHKSCEHMDEIPDGSVDLVVTSPPYWNAIDYEQHVADPEAWYRTRKETPYEEYLDWLKVCFTEVFRKQKPGGFCAVVIGTVLMNGQQYPVPQHLVVLMEEIGYEYHQEIVWHKVTGGVKRAGVTIQHPYPGYYHPNIMSESILVLRKPGPKIFERRSQTEKDENRIDINGIFTREIANNVWHIAPVPPNYLPHPCPFPEEIPYRLILLYSYKGDLVLDPFLGIGTTAKAAKALGRRYAGYDIQGKYVEIARKRLDEPLHLREQLIPRFEKMPVEDRQFIEHLSQHQAKARQLAFIDLADREPGVEYIAEQRGVPMDYEALAKKAPWLRERGHKMIVSSDLDGLLSGALLSWLLDWKVIGFYDAENIWVLFDHTDILGGEYVFVDHDICRREVISIGHHMLQYNPDIPVPAYAEPDARHVNPNLIRGFNADQHFDKKYPFATIHFLLCCYNAWGNLASYRIPREFLPLLLHVDSPMRSAVDYDENVLEWLDWLGSRELDFDSPIYPLCAVLRHTPPIRLLEWRVAIRDKLYGGRRRQCEVNNPTDPQQWTNVRRLLDWVSEISQWAFEWPDFPNLAVQYLKLPRASRHLSKKGFREVMEQSPFSFAITDTKTLNYSLWPETPRWELVSPSTAGKSPN